MHLIKKVPYYTMEPSLFRGKVWKEYDGSTGAIPINTPQTISLDRLAPGEKPPPPPPKTPKPTAEQIKQQQLEVAKQRTLAEQAKTHPEATTPQPKPKVLDAEDHDKIPEFDLQDIPGAMDKMGWPISAKLARKWFAGSKHIWDNDLNSVQPIDDTTVTLEWTLKFGNVKKKYNEILLESIYSDHAITLLKKKLKTIFEKNFQNSMNLEFNTTSYLKDLREFHRDWHFQYVPISSVDTMEGVMTFTDLTGSLANFNIYVALGNVEVLGDKYYMYDKERNTKSSCRDVKVRITHVYIYVKDNYSFNDGDAKKSQYLGHWNKKGIIVTTGGVVSELVDGKGIGKVKIYSNMGASPSSETQVNWNYLMSNPLDKPVDKRTGIIRKLLEKDVYFPVYNRNYNEWRKRHNKGIDFMIYSKPKYMKLKKPIEFTMERLCRQPEKM